MVSFGLGPKTLVVRVTKSSCLDLPGSVATNTASDKKKIVRFVATNTSGKCPDASSKTSTS